MVRGMEDVDPVNATEKPNPPRRSSFSSTANGENLPTDERMTSNSQPELFPDELMVVGCSTHNRPTWQIDTGQKKDKHKASANTNDEKNLLRHAPTCRPPGSKDTEEKGLELFPEDRPQDERVTELQPSKQTSREKEDKGTDQRAFTVGAKELELARGLSVGRVPAARSRAQGGCVEGGSHPSSLNVQENQGGALPHGAYFVDTMVTSAMLDQERPSDASSAIVAGAIEDYHNEEAEEALITAELVVVEEGQRNRIGTVAAVVTQGEQVKWGPFYRSNVLILLAIAILIVSLAVGLGVGLSPRSESQGLPPAPTPVPTTASPRPTISSIPSTSPEPSDSPSSVPTLLAGVVAGPVVWNQVGQTLVGTGVGDLFGSKMAMSGDGSVVAVGAYRNDDNGTSSGHVQVYELLDGGNWNASTIIVGYTGSFSGYSVALAEHGRILAVGAPGGVPDDVPSGQGHIYFNNGTNWAPLGDSLDGKTANKNLGWAIELSGDGRIVAVSDPIYEQEDGSAVGQVKVYELSADDSTWQLKGSPLVGDANGDEFGFSLSLSRDGLTIAVGARFGDPDQKTNAGQARVYRFAELTGVWEKLGQLLKGETTNSDFGCSVSLSTIGDIDVVAIGSRWSSANGFRAGQVQVFRLVSSNMWEQLGSTILGVNQDDWFGYDLALSNDRLILAIEGWWSDLQDAVFTTRGRIGVYGWNGFDWEKLGLDIYGDSAEDRFGTSVVVSSNGSIVGGGADQLRRSFVNGYARVFERQVL